MSANKPVDVLQVMTLAIRSVRPGVSPEHAEWHRQLTEARAGIAALIVASKRMRDNFRTTLSVNCKCDDEFIDKQTAEFDSLVASIQSGDA